MLRRLAIWILGEDPFDAYMRGWHHGVMQWMHDPGSCTPSPRYLGGYPQQDVWPSYSMYMYGEEEE